MAKKKKSKKHNFAHSKPAKQSSPQPLAKSESTAAPAPLKQPQKQFTSGPTTVAAYEVAHLPEIKADIRRVLVLAVVFVVLQVVLWYVFEHTAVGPHIYNLVKL